MDEQTRYRLEGVLSNLKVLTVALVVFAIAVVFMTINFDLRLRALEQPVEQLERVKE